MDKALFKWLRILLSTPITTLRKQNGSLMNKNKLDVSKN